MKNQESTEREREEKNQDSLSAEKEHNHTDQKSKDVISIKDVSEKHPLSDAIRDMPQDEQQYDDFPKAEDDDAERA